VSVDVLFVDERNNPQAVRRPRAAIGDGRLLLAVTSRCRTFITVHTAYASAIVLLLYTVDGDVGSLPPLDVDYPLYSGSYI
jgi:hypothetical protein